MVVVWFLIGCGSTCPEQLTVQVEDGVDGTRLEQTALDFQAWSGATCLAEMTVTENALSGGDLWRERDGWHLTIRPDATDFEARVRLCETLFYETRVQNKASGDLFGSTPDERHEAFLVACAEGPTQDEPVCTEPEPSAQRTFIDAEVYPHHVFESVDWVPEVQELAERVLTGDVLETIATLDGFAFLLNDEHDTWVEHHTAAGVDVWPALTTLPGEFAGAFSASSERISWVERSDVHIVSSAGHHTVHDLSPTVTGAVARTVTLPEHVVASWSYLSGEAQLQAVGPDGTTTLHPLEPSDQDRGIWQIWPDADDPFSMWIDLDELDDNGVLLSRSLFHVPVDGPWSLRADDHAFEVLGIDADQELLISMPEGDHRFVGKLDAEGVLTSASTTCTDRYEPLPRFNKTGNLQLRRNGRSVFLTTW